MDSPTPPADALPRVAAGSRHDPGFVAEYRLIEVALRDCTMAYLWNPIVSAEEFEYDVAGTTMYAGIDDATRTLWVVFRGTDQLVDWLVNLAFLPLPLAHPWAHGGFVLAWKLAKRRFMPWLRAQAGRIDRVFVTGHSLGGAMALACAYELRVAGFDVVRCITVGAPRLYVAPSLKKVEEQLGGRLVRIVKEKDFVPRVPPEFLGFRHLGEQWNYVGTAGGKGEAQPFPRLMRWLDTIWGRFVDGCEWVEKKTGLAMDGQMVGFWLVVIGSIGGGFAWLAQSIQFSLVALSAATTVVLVVSAVFIAIGAHRSGRYAATRAAASMVEEWQLHYLRALAAGKELESAGEGESWLDIPTTISLSHPPRHKRRLLRAFRRKFGKAAFETATGRRFERAQITQYDARTQAAIDVTRLDAKLAAVCVALQLFGYGSEEIDRMLADGVIRRPQHWSRYYVEPGPAAAAAAVPPTETPATPAAAG